jgi:hypothetical protein
LIKKKYIYNENNWILSNYIYKVKILNLKYLGIGLGFIDKNNYLKK